MKCTKCMMIVRPQYKILLLKVASEMSFVDLTVWWVRSVVCRRCLPRGRAGITMGGSHPHSGSGGDVKLLIQDAHSHHLTHTNTHLTFHIYRHSSWVLWTFSSYQPLPCVSRQGKQYLRMVRSTLFSKKKKKKTVSNEHERDNIYLLYSSTSSHLLFLVALSGR